MPVPKKLPTLSKTDLKINMVGQEIGTMSGLAEALAGQSGGWLPEARRQEGLPRRGDLELSHEGQVGVPQAG